MKLFLQFENTRVSDAPCVFTFGNFDGLHKGHDKLFQRLKENGKRFGLQTALLTFSNHPSQVIGGETVLQITSDEHKLRCLKKYHLDFILSIPFTKEIAALSPDEFIDKVQQMFFVKMWVAGDDVAFGKNRLGNKELLVQRAEKDGFQVDFIEKETSNSHVISSSLIRKKIQEGKLDEVEKLLGRPFSHVFPIKNGSIDATGLCLPPDGVWKASVNRTKTHVQIDKNKVVVDTLLPSQGFIEIEYERKVS